MASSEKIVSPGVFTNEIDQSFLPAALGDIGGAVVGPTVKGPAMIPTVVSSMNEFVQIFGETFNSASNTMTYLTSETARQYLKHGNRLTVVRILDGAFTNASANVPTGSGNESTGSATIGSIDSSDVGLSFKLHTHNQGEILNNRIKTFNSISGSFEGASGSSAESAVAKIALANDSTIDNVGSGDVISLITADGKTVTCTLLGSGGSTTSATTDGNVQAKTFAGGTSNNTQGTAQAAEIATAINYNNYFTATNSGSLIEVVQAVPGAVGNTTVTITEIGATGMNLSHSFQNGRDSVTGESGLLVSGSVDNVRWQVTNSNHKKGTFNLLIRAGNDTNRQKQVLETWNGVSMDPNQQNYVAKVIGDSKPVLSSPGSEPYIAMSGSYPNKSKYVRVEVVKPATDYLDENGNTTTASYQNMPGNGSGSFGGAFSSGSSGWVGFDAFGNLQGGGSTDPLFYESISDTNTQGYTPETANQGKTAYEDAISILSNADEYDINLLFLPGIIDNFSNHQTIVTKAINVCEDRADTFLIVDPAAYSDNPSSAQTRAEARNSSYAAMYHPWVQMGSPSLGRSIWVPPSVAVAGVYAFSDKVSHEWFAPAGLNRGTIDNATNVQRKLTRSLRDDLYNSNVNPIAQFPGQGVVIYGQKTLQKKSSALDRVNVRRLLIKLKKFIAGTSRFLVFEQNNSKTRNRFLNIVNPYLEQVQSNSGLNVFKVVMDETNNTPDIVDRNQLYGQIFLQPTRTAEFIVLDFNVMRTGASFPE